MTDTTTREQWKHRAKIIALGFLLADSVYLTFHNANVVWTSWSLNARWPWWFHSIVAFIAFDWLRELHRKRP